MNDLHIFIFYSCSAATEHGYLATSDCMSDSVVSMKKIPNFPGLVVGHTAFGDFCLW